MSIAQNTEQILGGGYANVQQTPIAFLFSSAGSCSGSVIGKKTILTARHCLVGFGNSKIYAGVGGRIYSIRNSYRGPNDLALVVTNSTISSSRYKVKKNTFPPIGLVFAVLGFGAPNIGYLKYTYMVVSGYENSGSFIADSIDGSTTCVGDSGGPAVVPFRGRTIVLGVVSRGQASCGVGSSTAFGATGSNRGFNWISSQLKAIEG